MTYLIASPADLVTEDGLRLLRGSHLPLGEGAAVHSILASARRMGGEDVRLYRVERDGGWWRVVEEVEADAPASSLPRALDDIHAERARQIAKGYDAAHDDQYSMYELSTVAAAVALGATDHISGDVPAWAGHIIEKWNTRQRLVIAAALLVAEIERLDRVQARGSRRAMPPNQQITPPSKETP